MHPLTGNWRANIEKSQRHANHHFQDATMSIVVQGTDVRIGYGGVNASGKDEAGTQVIQADGKEHAHPAAPDLFTTGTLDANSVRIVAKQGDKVVGDGHYHVAADGATMTATVSGVDANGQPFDQVIIFDRI